MLKKINISICFFIVLTFCQSCDKFIDAKPDQSLLVPSTLADLSSMLNTYEIMNGKNPTFDIASADEYFVTVANYNTQSEISRKTYIWENFEYNFPNDWSFIYDKVNIANIVLETLSKIPRTPSNGSNWDSVKGSALFLRGSALLRGLWVFAKSYDESTAGSDMGIAIRLESDASLKSIRSNNSECYNRVLDDLLNAAALLPALPSVVVSPSKSAAYGYLARAYLSMRKYDLALKYSNLSLGLKNALLDYKTVNISANRPFDIFNPEVVFQSVAENYNYSIVFLQTAYVDPVFYSSYAVNDLRKQAFYQPISGGYYIKSTYAGSRPAMFHGVATDEMYLTRAECYARAGNTSSAMSDLNTLLIKRFDNTFVPLTATNSAQALVIILNERKKELVFRGLRWMDIKRLNKEGANISLTRTINGNTYTLPANSNRFALPLPTDIINLTGMPQNPR